MKEIKNFEEYLDKMLINKNKHIQIVALYWKFKEYDYDNTDQVDRAIGRDSKAATKLIGYSNDRIKATMDYLEKVSDFKWTLETVHKYIDEVHKKKKDSGIIKL